MPEAGLHNLASNDRIANTPNITLLAETQIVGGLGQGKLEAVTLQTGDDRRDVACQALFVMIGADPCTEWLEGCVGMDARRFILTGADAAAYGDFAGHWHLSGRRPFYLETTRPRIFAVGDVRAGSVKRVASAVGEGSIAVKFVHDALA
ncbi:MAG: NAD(P)/FAD-dependent oxidoreductase [Phycisphaerae bacterium]